MSEDDWVTGFLDPLVLQSPELRDENFYRCFQLAVAVLRRAILDLCISEYGAQKIRQDAYEFLTKTLWEEDNLWGSILSGFISKEAVLRLVEERCLRTEGGGGGCDARRVQ